MICVILNIVLIVFYIVFVMFAFKKRKEINDNNTYSFITSYPKIYVKIGIFFLILTIILHIVSIILFFAKSNAMWVLFGVGSFLGLITTILFYDLLLDYEAIQGSYLYIKRPFKLKEVCIYDIDSITSNGTTIACFYNKDGKCLFMMDITTHGYGEIIEYVIGIKKQRDENITLFDNNNYSVSTKKLSDEGKEIIKQIGKEYKESLSKKKRFITILCLLLLIILTTLLFNAYKNTDNPSIITLLLLSDLCVIIGYLNGVSKYKKEQKMTNTNLGKIYYYKNKNVVGSSFYRYKKTSKNVTVLAIMCFIFSVIIGIISIFDKPLPQERLELVGGNVEYATYQKVGKIYNIVIGLEETNSEYRINGTALDAVDIDEFLDEVDKGTHITLYVDNKYRYDKGEVDKSKTKWTYVYSAYTNDDVYFSYEDYVFYEQKDTHLAYFVSIGTFLIGIGSIAYLNLIKKLTSKSKDKEYIDAYN